MLFSLVSQFYKNPLPNIDCTVGDINVHSVDESGGRFLMSKHGIVITVPKMAISSGMVAEMQTGVTLIAPVMFSNNAIPVSAIIWLCINATLQKPIKLQVPHYVNVKTESQSKQLQFAKSFVHSWDNTQMGTMEGIEGGIFPVGESYGTIEVDHFCFYCIQRNVQVDDIPDNLYRIVTMKEKQPNLAENLWKIHICITPQLATCLEVCLQYAY